jgi:hypothetical protein
MRLAERVAAFPDQKELVLENLLKPQDLRITAANEFSMKRREYSFA